MAKRKKPKFDTPAMKRFEELGRKVFSSSKGDLKKPIAAEEDAEEIMAGGIPPTEPQESDE
jgi:hypothetical protein